MTPTQTPQQTVTLDQALDAAEALPDEQLESLLEILQKRRLERKRAEFVARVEEAEVDYANGDVTRGNAAQIMKALSSERTDFDKSVRSSLSTPARSTDTTRSENTEHP